MRPFEYKPLSVPDDEIRLVRILPGSGTDELRCIMTHELLTLSLNYQALSYTWADHQLSRVQELDKTEELLVNDDSSLYIRENLASYFQHIRRADRMTGYIWVDAICINQRDIVERSFQVLRMREIYKLAGDVVVWLGPEKEDSTAALSFIEQNMDIRVRDTQVSSTGFFWWGTNEMAKIEKDVQVGTSISHWKAVNQLFKRAWWGRTWVVQEVFLAREIIFMCGHKTVGWVSLWTLLENLWAHSHWTRRVISDVPDLLENCSPGRTILWLRQKKDGLDLLKTLYHLRSSHASEPKDKVYGILGLASDAKLIVPFPDYSLSLEQIYINLLKTMTGVRGDLDWLTLAGNLGDSSDLPTWCPDLAKKSPLVSMKTSRSMSEGKTYGFCAAKCTLPVAEFHSAPLRCTISGFVADIVDGLGPRQGYEDVADDIVQPNFDCRGYETDIETYGAIWKALVADQDFEGTKESWRAPPSFGLVYAKQTIAAQKYIDASEQKYRLPELSHLGLWYARNRNVKFANKTIGDWTREMGQGAAQDLDGSLDYGFERRLRSTIGCRRITTTEKGYFGLVHNDVRQGDQVCIFFGGRMPVILRPDGEHYHFIGECYIHGLMFGKAVEIFELRAYESKKFILT